MLARFGPLRPLLALLLPLAWLLGFLRTWLQQPGQLGRSLVPFVLGIALLIASGLGGPAALLQELGCRGHWRPLDVILGTMGFWLAFTAVTPLVQRMNMTARLHRSWNDTAHTTFAHASTAQRVFVLLLSVAEAAGQSGPKERELVRSFLRSRFADPRQRDAVDAWSTKVRVLRDLTALARQIASTLDPGECATLYSWSCLVAFADGTLQPQEHAALQQIARGFGLPPHHAMFLFEFAQQAAKKQRFGGGPAGSERDERTRPGNGRNRTPPQPTQSLSDRERALATLGLPADATPQAIRHRHRELVRSCHPDAHRTLGPIALREATDRFLAIQRAYEVLTG